MPPACGDATAVEQIFANLISNAVHYLDPTRSGHDRSRITESFAGGNALAGFHVYYVKDNGLGIPEAYHQRVFTAFNRLHANVAQGEGIGLALVAGWSSDMAARSGCSRRQASDLRSSWPCRPRRPMGTWRQTWTGTPRSRD